MTEQRSFTKDEMQKISDGLADSISSLNTVMFIFENAGWYSCAANMQTRIESLRNWRNEFKSLKHT